MILTALFIPRNVIWSFEMSFGLKCHFGGCLRFKPLSFVVIRQRLFGFKGICGLGLRCHSNLEAFLKNARKCIPFLFLHRLEALPLHCCLILGGKPCQNAAGNGGNASIPTRAIILKKSIH